MTESVAKPAFVFAFACIVALFTITYALQVPHMLTGHPDIVNEYYGTRFTTSVPLDMLFIAVYLLVAHILSILFELHESVSMKTAVVAATTAVITAAFCSMFRSQPRTDTNFFSKWFHTVGYSSVVYDVVLIVFVHLLYEFMASKVE